MTQGILQSPDFACLPAGIRKMIAHENNRKKPDDGIPDRE
jgi:hypothetical protein